MSYQTLGSLPQIPMDAACRSLTTGLGVPYESNGATYCAGGWVWNATTQEFVPILSRYQRPKL